MRRTAPLFVLIAMYGCLQAQVLTVIDQQTFDPIDLVTISSPERTDLFATTDLEGRADITAFQGVDTIEIRFIGYRMQRRSYSELRSQGFLVYLLPQSFTLDNIVISAVRWDSDKRKIPVRITSIRPENIAFENPQTAADLLGSSDEVFIQKSQQGGGSPMIRGFSTNRLLIAVDGVRMNTAIFRSGNLQNVISLDPFAIRRTEVLFGPGSVIYGSDAIGGVMHFQTLLPSFSESADTRISGSAAVRYASANNERTGHVHVQAGWQKWAFLTSITYTDYDDLRMGRHGRQEYLRPFYVRTIDGTDVTIANADPLVQVPTGYSQYNLMQKVRFSPNDAWDVHYGLHTSATTNYPRYDRHIRLRKGRPRSAEWYYGPQIWTMHNLNAEHQSESALFSRLHIRAAAQYFEESRHDRDFNDPILFNRVEEVGAYSLNADFVKDLGSSQKLYYGAEWIHNDVTSTGTDQDITTGESQPGPSRYPKSDWSSYAIYGSYQNSLSERTTLQAGVRYNQFALNAEFDTTFYPFPFATAEIDNGALTGSLGIVYNADERWNLSVNLATGFRAPNVDDVGKVFDSEPGSVVVPNPGLNAEYVYNAELGIVRTWEETFKLDVAFYYTLLDNAMVRRDYSLNGMDSIVYDGELSKVQAIQNAADATVYGLQVGFEWKMPGGFTLTSRFNYQRGEEELDNGTKSPSRHAAPWFGATHLRFHDKKLKLDLYAEYNGEVAYEDLAEEERSKTYLYATDGNGNPFSPSWYTLNFKVQYQLTDVFSFSGGMENITDQRYRPYSSGVVAPGANFIASLRARF